MKIRIFIYAVMLILLLCANSYAQSKTDSNAVNGEILKKKPLAFQFAVGENFTLENFSRYNISAKKHVSQNFALRLGVGLNFSNQELDGSITQTASYSQEQDRSSNYISTQLDLIIYVNPRDVVKAYIGAGPYFSYSDNSRKTNSFSTINLTPYTSFEYQKLTSVGASILLGAEWFFTNKFSLFTEYNFLFTYTKITLNTSSNSQGEVFKTDLKGDDTAFEGESLRFGLSVYF